VYSCLSLQPSHAHDHPTPRLFLFFFNATAPTQIYTLSLHDALPISELHRIDLRQVAARRRHVGVDMVAQDLGGGADLRQQARPRSEEHTSELQSRENLVCRLLLEKKNTREKYARTQECEAGARAVRR